MTSIGLRQFCAIPSCSHDSETGVRIYAQQKVPDLMRDDVPQHVWHTDLCVLAQLLNPIKEDIGICAIAAAAHESRTKNLSFQLFAVVDDLNHDRFGVERS